MNILRFFVIRPPYTDRYRVPHFVQTKKTASKRLSFQQSIVAGGAAGFVSGFAFQPFEVLRTRSIGLMGVSSMKIAKEIMATNGKGRKL